ncbi:aspartyl-phosphate phosphatase Spo0E family protein [Bacillus carboniphilus]|uniref:Aspartyl-phosphate phosphatase Spo0E family protein n=1 Tax=Bacillus carboniphilus TaxID=86663 RepID=A0ABY9JU44_9BACI|nr:aspartyl-phosphate phosphatase Spo0E family protein [Bacillus carboniphilus]WLR42910.1 aspartyl-phosphate phosphatase Spo0E family protein [Bacillus carboniphilus]
MKNHEIEAKRQRLIEIAKKYGINARETIQCSQELDRLLIRQIKQSISGK